MRILVSVAAAVDSFEFTIPAKFKNLLRLTDKQKGNTVTNVENDLSFVNTQEVATVEHIEVTGNKIKVWPAMDVLDMPIAKVKPLMEKAFEEWATKAFKSQSSSAETLRASLEYAVGVTKDELEESISDFNSDTNSKVKIVGYSSPKRGGAPSGHVTIEGTKRDVLQVAAKWYDTAPNENKLAREFDLNLVKA